MHDKMIFPLFKATQVCIRGLVPDLYYLDGNCSPWRIRLGKVILIQSLDGNIWASSPELKPTAEEIKTIVNNVAKRCHDSVTINGKKLITLLAGDGELRAAGNEYAIDCRILKTMIIITGNSKPKDCPGVNRLLSQAGCAMATYLSDRGF
nr:Profilin allergen [Hymenolepis microstoma]